MGGSNFEFQYFFGFSKKSIFLGSTKILCIFLGGHHKIGLNLGVITCISGSFLKVKVQNGGYFLGLLKFQIYFWGA